MEKTKMEKTKTMGKLTNAWKMAGEVDPAKLDLSDIREAWKSEYSKEDCDAEDTGIKRGCRKLSWRMIKKMGEAMLTRMQMNAIIQLALHQDENGIAYTNNHIMWSALGCHESYFMDLLYLLEDAGLIRMERSADWRHHKKGIWRVKLLYNSFADGYEDDSYVRLGHSFFQSKRFIDMMPPAKYMAFRIFYEMRGFKKEELGDYADGHWPVLLGYDSLLQDTADWAGYCRDTCLDAFRAVAGTWEVKMKKTRMDGGWDTEAEVYLTPEDVRIEDTDDYNYIGGVAHATL